MVIVKAPHTKEGQKALIALAEKALAQTTEPKAVFEFKEPCGCYHKIAVTRGEDLVAGAKKLSQWLLTQRCSNLLEVYQATKQ